MLNKLPLNLTASEILHLIASNRELCLMLLNKSVQNHLASTCFVKYFICHMKDQ